MKTLATFGIAVVLLAISGCFEAPRQQVLFEAKDDSLRIVVTYTGRSEANDGRVVLSWSHSEFGDAGSVLLLQHLEFPESPGLDGFEYNPASRKVAFTVATQLGRKRIEIPVVAPSNHRERFASENALLLRDSVEAEPTGSGR